MKSNKFLYILYGAYLFVIVFFVKEVLLSSDRGLFFIVSMWFVPPVFLSIIPMILLKRCLLKKMVPSISAKEARKIACHTTLKSIGMFFVYAGLLAVVASILRMVVADVPSFMQGGLPQNNIVIAVEVFCLAGLFAWITRSVQYHIVWPMIIKLDQLSVRRALLYANMIEYMLLTIIFFIWQLMLFFQWPEWLWKWL